MSFTSQRVLTNAQKSAETQSALNGQCMQRPFGGGRGLLAGPWLRCTEDQAPSSLCMSIPTAVPVPGFSASLPSPGSSSLYHLGFTCELESRCWMPWPKLAPSQPGPPYMKIRPLCPEIPQPGIRSLVFNIASSFLKCEFP